MEISNNKVTNLLSRTSSVQLKHGLTRARILVIQYYGLVSKTTVTCKIKRNVLKSFAKILMLFFAIEIKSFSR